MATKTLSVDEEAYRILARARKAPDESFSKVIKRARWDGGLRRCRDVLSRARGDMDPKVLDRLDRAQKDDRPPDDPWHP